MNRSALSGGLAYIMASVVAPIRHILGFFLSGNLREVNVIANGNQAGSGRRGVCSRHLGAFHSFVHSGGLCAPGGIFLKGVSPRSKCRLVSRTLRDEGLRSFPGTLFVSDSAVTMNILHTLDRGRVGIPRSIGVVDFGSSTGTGFALPTLDSVEIRAGRVKTHNMLTLHRLVRGGIRCTPRGIIVKAHLVFERDDFSPGRGSWGECFRGRFWVSTHVSSCRGSEWGGDHEGVLRLFFSGSPGPS